jgi:hypothetical protein
MGGLRSARAKGHGDRVAHFILAELEPRLRVELVAQGLLDQHPTETFANWPGVFAARRNAALMPHERETPSSVKGRHLPAHRGPAVGRAERAMLAGIRGKLVHREGKDLYGFMRQPHVGGLRSRRAFRPAPRQRLEAPASPAPQS